MNVLTCFSFASVICGERLLDAAVACTWANFCVRGLGAITMQHYITLLSKQCLRKQDEHYDVSYILLPAEFQDDVTIKPSSILQLCVSGVTRISGPAS